VVGAKEGETKKVVQTTTRKKESNKKKERKKEWVSNDHFLGAGDLYAIQWWARN
jgi:hypothetical protein